MKIGGVNLTQQSYQASPFHFKIGE